MYKTKSHKDSNRKYTQFIKGPLFTRILLAAIVLFILSFFINIKMILFLIAAIVFNASLVTFQLDKGLPTDFELSTFTTVIMTMAFGLKAGIIAAIATKIIASVYTGSIIVDHMFMIGTYIFGALIANYFGGVGLPLIGFIIVITNNLIMFNISKFIIGLPITDNLAYTLTNFIFNMVVFSAFSSIVYYLVRPG
ncbi:MAG: hypothetical protein V1859_02595 [archaeon]